MARPFVTYQPLCFPSLSSSGWTTNLTVAPHISELTLEWWCDQKGPSARQRKKAYSFAIEAYCSPPSLRTNTCDSGLGIVPLVKTKAGLAPVGSPLTYQQSDSPHDFKTWISSTIAPGAGTNCAVPRLELFTGAVPHTFPAVFTADEQQILMHLQLSPEEAQEL
ncbi:hypothetical protein V5799_022419 [Amblyomma americanum]|uniref:Uncharacterized protein n=1 Tax=Amblyomma americanum TaxID=6943 RepID=A0AAQ4FKP5_AMBAM